MLRAVSRLINRPAVVEMAVNNFSTSGVRKTGKLEGKVAVVTASTDGIGLAIAERLGADGASVMISSRKEKNVLEAVKKLQSQGYKVAGTVCHVSKASDREQMLKEAVNKFGGIDILVSNAAVNPAVGSVFDCPVEAWDKIFEVNVKAAFLLSKEVLPYIRKRGGGSIVYISSITGYQPINLLGAYAVSKTALFGLTKAGANALVTENIRVNCVAPGLIKTNFSSAVSSIFEHGLLYWSPLMDAIDTDLAVHNLHETEVAREASLSLIPMGRFGEPKEIAGVVSFLVSDDASYVTGETIVAAGCMPSRL